MKLPQLQTQKYQSHGRPRPSKQKWDSGYANEETQQIDQLINISSEDKLSTECVRQKSFWRKAGIDKEFFIVSKKRKPFEQYKINIKKYFSKIIEWSWNETKII